jgi:hypothetical protein
MEDEMKKAILILVIFSALFSVSALSQTTAILIDTSRSISRQDFDAAKNKLSELAPELLRQGPVTVVSFNDAPVTEGSSLTDPSSVSQKIHAVSQGGKYTLLYDAVFKSLNMFEDSKEAGVIVLFSDGKDENSAVTIEDVAKKAESLKVPIITIGAGDDEKSLRRLSALTKGSYEGKASLFSSSALLASVSHLRAVKAPPPEEKPKVVPVAPPAPPPQPEQSFFSPLLIILLLFVLALVIAAVAGIFLLLKSRKEKETVCEKCGKSLSLWESECPYCFTKKLSDTQPGLPPSQAAEPQPPADLDPELFKKAPTTDELDSTMIIEEIPILLHMRGNQPPHMFQVAKNKATSVGRDKANNTIFVDDRTLSGQHFRVVPKDGLWYILDLDSTNGTFVDGEKVKFKEIKPGAQIHAGQCQFLFRIEQKRLTA